MPLSTSDVFTQIKSVTLPATLACQDDSGRNQKFSFTIIADGIIPFPQVIFRTAGCEYICKQNAIHLKDDNQHTYVVEVAAGSLAPGSYEVQVEGCRVAAIEQAHPEDWVKSFHTFTLTSAPVQVATPAKPPAPTIGAPTSAPTAGAASQQAVKIYFGIHKHMHQPYYNATDTDYWDGEKDGIFGERVGPYTGFIPAAIRQYISGDLPHAGLSTSWSGSLIDQLNRCREAGRCGGGFQDWNRELRELAQAQTALGNPRLDFAGFGYFHPLMPLIPARDIVKQINLHREVIREAFGCEASPVLFPPETAFHVRMIPALCEAGIEAVIYDSIHRFRACRDYPYAGVPEGMLPPNPAEQVNPPVTDWLQLQNIWAASRISPSLLRPEYVSYEDADGVCSKIIAVPAERYLGNEDARGGFGALQYPDILGQLQQQISVTGSFDPAHPPFFLLHSDGDNYGGGADSYYHHNTGELVRWLQSDPRFELTTTRDYLSRFPPDPNNCVHIEPGSWAGADNGDPQFMKWFSRYNEDYSPDLNSWAVLTALQNCVHSIEDSRADFGGLAEMTRLLLTAETSCYWYWTGQDIWDAQVTNAANQAYHIAGGEIDALCTSHADRTPPTIFPPWTTPENPGGKAWGNNELIAAAPQGTLHTFIADLSGIVSATITLRSEKGEETLPLVDHGAYPTNTGARRTANYYTVVLPLGLGDTRYFITAEDGGGNVARSALERIFLP